MKLPGWWYRWIDHRGRISRLEHWLWPELHWCAEQDDLLEETFQPFCTEACRW